MTVDAQRQPDLNQVLAILPDAADGEIPRQRRYLGRRYLPW
jgi:hypothetical protein